MKSSKPQRWAGTLSAAFVLVALGSSATATDTDPQPPMTMELAREITHSTRPLTVEEIDRFEEALAVRWGAARPDQVAEKLKGTLETLGRDGGATWISEEDTLNIYVSGPADGKAAAVDKVKTLVPNVIHGSNVKVQIHAGGVRSEAQLVSTMDTVADVKSYDPTGTVEVRSQRIDYTTGKVQVDVTSRAAADIVEKQFGDAVQVQVKAPYTQDEIDEMLQVENRRNDSPSNGWNGGTAMCPANSGDCTPGASAGDAANCTTGLKWVLGGQVRLATAGHCFAFGATNYYRYEAPRYGIATPAGTTWRLDTGVDGALIDPPNGYSVRNEFWIGGRYGSDSRTITAWDDTTSVGQPLLISGANSGVHTGEVRTVFDRECLNLPLTTTNISGTVGGDSGGTVAQPNAASPESGDYVALGVHSCKPDYAFARFSRAATIANELGGYPATN